MMQAQKNKEAGHPAIIELSRKLLHPDSYLPLPPQEEED
jgi:hypothetical protein